MDNDLKAKVYDCAARTLGEGHLAIGGQRLYPDGPSGLLTIYQDGRALVEVQITEPLAEAVARLLVERTRSWCSDDR